MCEGCSHELEEEYNFKAAQSFKLKIPKTEPLQASYSSEVELNNRKRSRGAESSERKPKSQNFAIKLTKVLKVEENRNQKPQALKSRKEARQAASKQEKQSKNVTFKCHICWEDFPDENALEMHKDDDHFRHKKFECELCGRKYLKNVDLQKHLKHCHISDTPKLKTALTPKKEISTQKLNEASSAKKKEVSTPKQETPTPKLREARYPRLKEASTPKLNSVYDNTRPFPCTVKGCGKYFKKRTALNEHMISHSGKIKLRYLIFLSDNNFSDARPFRCHCGKTYKYNKDLRKHRINCRK